MGASVPLLVRKQPELPLLSIVYFSSALYYHSALLSNALDNAQYTQAAKPTRMTQSNSRLDDRNPAHRISRTILVPNVFSWSLCLFVFFVFLWCLVSYFLRPRSLRPRKMHLSRKKASVQESGCAGRLIGVEIAL